MNFISSFFITCLLFVNFSCDSDNSTIPDNDTNVTGIAVVEKVTVSGKEGSYSFAVTIKSPDTGCDQYADWWEVITEQETLIYRRILAHSHVDEQPFTRSGGGVNIAESDIMIIRGHMNNTGYGETSMRGSVKEGFEPFVITQEFGASLENEEPLPKGCAF